MTHRILIVDDEPGILKALKRLLVLTPCIFNGETFRLQVDCCSCPEDALRAVRGTPYEMVISDFRMPGMDGVQLLKAVREIQPHAVRFILSGYADLQAQIGAINEAQISRFIGKPWNDYELVSAIAQGLAWRALQVETERLADEKRLERQLATPEEIERKRLEAEEPGITDVRWGDDGSVILDPDLQAEYERQHPNG
jgi:DNA-binding NtrC family response regulator